jgi:23S rRNA (cytidine2498-2'-O)-methyltransferase
MVADARFLFVICQVGAESALKAELARSWPAFRLAFSRPGFVTFKLPATFRFADDFELGSTLARTSGFSLGKVASHSAEEAAHEAWRLVGQPPYNHLHVWQRDTAIPGDRGFEPGETPLAMEVASILTAARPPSENHASAIRLNEVARRGERILDCVVVEPSEWWLGWHVATDPHSQWPGGVPVIKPPQRLVSRAYFKMIEALEWSQLPLKPGDHCAEIGSAPGGAAQALLERGLIVLGIDPAEMDPKILGDPRFTHVRKRVADLKRREFRSVKWLFTDSNISPQDSLDDVEAIVTHREVHVRGLLVTLKLSDWSAVDDISKYVERVRGWGFSEVITRQLAFNRREICLAASRTAKDSKRAN